MPIQEDTVSLLLKKDEDGALDFKRKPHAIYHKDKNVAERNQHELIRDVVALAKNDGTTLLWSVRTVPCLSILRRQR